MQRGTIKVCNLWLSLGGISVHMRTSANTHTHTHTYTVGAGITENGSELSNFQELAAGATSSRRYTECNIQGGARSKMQA